MAVPRPILVFLLLAAVLLVNPADSIQRNLRSSPPDELEITCIEDGFFSHPQDCAKYYRCVSRRRYDFSCGPGTHYNPSIVGCDHPEKAGCRIRHQNGNEVQSQPEVELISTPQPNPEMDGISGEYIDCVNVCRNKHYPKYDKLRKEQFQKMTINQNYHPEMAQIIQEPGYVYYRKKVITTGQNGGQWESWENKGSEGSEGSWIVHEGQPDWNQKEYSWNHSGPNGKEEHKYEKESIDNQEIVCFDNGISHAHPASCTKYYLCENGRRFDFDCQPGLHYSVQHQNCLPPNQAKCNQTSSQTQVTTTKTTQTTTVIKRKILVPFVVYENGKSVEQKFDYETLFHGADQNQVQKVKHCDDLGKPEKLCTQNNFEWLQVADTELDHKKIKPKREVKMEKEVQNLSKECYRLCTVLQPKNGSYIECIAFTFSTESRKCILYDQLELNFNWFTVLVKGKQPKGLRTKRHTSTTINIPKTYQIQEKWLIGPAVPKDLVKKHKSSQYKLIDITYNNIYNCLQSCVYQNGCQQFVFDSTTGKCFLRKDWEAVKEDDSSEEDSSEEKDDEKTKTVTYKSGWVSGENQDIFVKLNQENVEVIKVKEIKDNPGQNHYGEFKETDRMTGQKSGHGQSFEQVDVFSGSKPKKHHHDHQVTEGNQSHSQVIVQKPEESSQTSTTKVVTKVTETQRGHQQVPIKPGGSKQEIQEIRTTITSGKTVCLNEGLFPHSTSCSKFLECANGEIFTKDCAPGTLYNPLIKACDFPDKSGCKINGNGQTEFQWKEVIVIESGSTSGSTPKTHTVSNTKKTVKTIKTTTIASGKVVCLEEGTFPHPTSCSHFYVCTKGELFTKSCTHPATLYNPLTKTCDSPEKSGCKIGANGQVEFEWKSVIVTDAGHNHGQQLNTGSSSTKATKTTKTIITKIINGTVIEVPESSPGYKSNVVTKSPIEYSHFTTTSSKSGSYTKVEKRVIPTEGSAHYTTPRPGGTTSTHSQTEVITKKVITSSKTVCLEEGMFPHQSDCTKFYHCAAGQLFTKDCGPGTHYNPLLKVCDWPGKAGCKVNTNGQTEFEWNQVISSAETPSHANVHQDGSSTTKTVTTTTTIRRKMLIPFVKYGNATNKVTYEKSGRLISEDLIYEHDGIGLKLKDVPICTPESDNKLCALRNFEWLQIKDQEITSKDIKPKKEVIIEKNKNIGEECHKLCQTLKESSENPDSKYIACVAYTFSDESRKCALYSTVILEHNWIDVLLAGTKKAKNLRPKRHTISRINIPQSFIAQSQWLISPSVPKELVSKKHSSEYKVFELANANILECINVCEHSPEPCGQFFYDSVQGKCFLKKEKPETDSTDEEEEEEEEEEKFKKIIYKSGWVSGKNLNQLINQGQVSQQIDQDTSDSNTQKIIRTKEYIDIVKPNIPESTTPKKVVTKVIQTNPKITINSVDSNQEFQEIRKVITSGKTVCLEQGLFPHSTSCSKFLECANGEIFTKDCAPGTLYNPLIKACDFPDKSGCKINANGQTEFEWKEVIVTESESTFGSPKPHFHPVENTTKTVKTITTQTITSGKVVCLEEGTFPHPTSCSQFHVCTKGQLLTKSCTKPGTLYNPLTKTCDSPEKSGCKIGANGQVEFEWKSVIVTKSGTSSQKGNVNQVNTGSTNSKITKLVNGSVVTQGESPPGYYESSVVTQSPKEYSHIHFTTSSSKSGSTIKGEKNVIRKENNPDVIIVQEPEESSNVNTIKPQDSEYLNVVEKVIVSASGEPIEQINQEPDESIKSETKAPKKVITSGTTKGPQILNKPENSKIKVTVTEEQIFSDEEPDDYNKVIQTNGHQNPASRPPNQETKKVINKVVVQKETGKQSPPVIHHPNGSTKETQITKTNQPDRSQISTSPETIVTEETVINSPIRYLTQRGYETSPSDLTTIIKTITKTTIKKKIIVPVVKYLNTTDVQIIKKEKFLVEDETQNEPEPIQNDSTYMEKFKTCDSNPDKKLCTLNNYEWLQMSDTEIKSNDDQAPTSELTIKELDIEMCQKLCTEMVSAKTSKPELTSSGCIAFSYSSDTGRCTLFKEIQLETSWLTMLIDGTSQPQTLRKKRDEITRVNVLKSFTINEQWITNYRVPTVQTLTRYYQIIKITTKTFIGCLNGCAEKTGCHQVVYDDEKKVCYIRNGKAEPETSQIDEKVTIRSKWISAKYLFKNEDIENVLISQGVKPKDLAYTRATDQTGTNESLTKASTKKPGLPQHLIYKNSTRSKIFENYSNSLEESNQIDGESKISTNDQSYLYSIPNCSSQNQKLCNVNNFEWLQLADTEIGRQVRPSKEMNFTSNQNIADQCHKACIQMRPKNTHEWHVPDKESQNPDEFQSCVAYSYSVDTKKCFLYEELELQVDWIQQLLTGTELPGTRNKRKTTTRIVIPQVELQFDVWLISPNLPIEYMQNMGFRLNQIPIVRFTADEIYEPFNAELVECASTCEKAKHECRQFVYNTDNRICYYVGPEEGDLTQKVLLKTGWVSGLYFRRQEGNQSTTEKEIKCEDDGYYPNPTDCTKYFRCANGRRYDFTCGPGTHYNPKIMNCDWPSNAGCSGAGNRQSVEQIQTSKISTQTGSAPIVTGSSSKMVITKTIRKQFRMPYLAFKQETRELIERIYGKKFIEQNWLNESKSNVLDSLPECSLTDKHICTVDKQWIQTIDSWQISQDVGAPFHELIIEDYSSKDVGKECFKRCQTMKTYATNTELYIPCVGYSYSPDTGKCFLYDQLTFETNWLEKMASLRNQKAEQDRTKREVVSRFSIPQADIIRNWLIGPNLPVELMRIIQKTEYANLIESSTQFIDVINAASIEKCSKSCHQSMTLYKKRCRYFLLNSIDQMCFLVNEQYLDKSKVGEKVEYRAGWVSGEYLIEDTNGSANVIEDNEIYSQVECQGTGFYPHPSDCSKFFRCVHEQYVGFDCAPGTHFDSKTSTCDWPHKAGCKNGAGAESSHAEVIEEVITKKKCATCSEHDHSDSHEHDFEHSPGHDHEEDQQGQESKVITEDDVLRILEVHGGQANLEEQLESTKVDEKTKTIHLPFVVTDNETKITVPNLETDYDDEIIHNPHTRTISTFPTCSSQTEESSNSTTRTQPCTMGNYEWLQMADTTLETSQTKVNKEMTLKPGKNIGETCHRLCQKMAPLGGNSGNQNTGFISCVAYSFEPETGKCTLFSELELPVNWVQMVTEVTTTTTTTTTIFKKSPGIQTRINIPKSQLILKQWLISPKIPTGISYTKTTTGETIYSTEYQLVTLMTENFFGCFYICAEKESCDYFVYNSIDKKCFIKTDIVQKPESEDEKQKITYRSGWVSVENIRELLKRSQILQPKTGKNRFYIETSPVILDLIEQYLLKKDYHTIIPRGQRKYLNPIETINSVVSLEECENRCAESWWSSDAEEEKSIANEKEENDEEEVVDIKRRKRFLNIRKQLQKYNENKQKESTKKYKCKFIAVRENLLEQGTNKTYTCQLYSEEAVEIQIKLLSKLTKQHPNILSKASEFMKGQVGSVTSFLKNSFGKKTKRSQDDSFQHQHQNTSLINAYVFYDNPTIRFYPVDEVETIRQAEASQESFMNWNQVLSDQKCFKECLVSWNALIRGKDGRKCRLLVVKAVPESHNTTTYNCTFYESDPSHPVTGFETLQYEIHSYPYEMPVSFSHSAAYFNQIKSGTELKLKKVDQMNEVEEINYCLHHCLKQWIKPKAPFSLEGPKCRHVAVVEDSVSRNGFTKYNCTFSDLLEESSNSNASGSLGSAEQVAFQLRQLPSSEAFKNQSLKHVDYFDAIPVESKMIDTILASHKPLYLLDYPQDYAECLKICVDLWARIKLGDTRPDRCRLIVVKKSSGDDQFRKIVTKKTLFQCAIYDMELEKKLLKPNRILSSDQLKLTRIFRHKVSTDSTDEESHKLENYETVPPPIVPGILKIISKQTKSFYHFTRAVSPQECLDHCLEMKVTGHNEQCQLAVARPVIGEDLQTSRRQLEYECSFYDYNLEFTAESSPQIPSVESYQLMKSNDKKPHFNPIDAHSEPVQFATDSYEPIHTIQNATSKDQCLTECLTFKDKNKLNNLVKSMDCKMVTVIPRIVRLETVVDYTCNFYNFNVTEYRLADLDQPEPVRGFELNWQGFSFTDLFNANFKQSATTSKFSPITSLRPLYSTTRQRKAFFHLDSVKEPTECFSLCLNTWTMGFLFNAQRRLCRFVTVRTKYDQTIAGNLKYDCALYSQNLTNSLESLHILVQPPLPDNQNLKSPTIPQDRIITESGSIYHQVSWRVPLPFESDATKVLSNPVNLNYCLQECDRNKSKCLAVLTLKDNKGNLTKCQLIAGDEYYPDLASISKDKEQSSVLVKITNVDEELRNTELTLVDREQLKVASKNLYLSILKAMRNYELNEPLADKLSYSL